MPKELILFEEDDWSLKQDYHKTPLVTPAGWYSPIYIAHKHTNFLGKERWIPTNMDHGFYTLPVATGEAWKYQCGKCGKDTPSEVKTRFRLLDDE